MSLLRKFREKFHDDWCSQCTAQMETVFRRLYALPDQRVGHYVSHREAAYYISHLVPVEKKAQIPTGTYACGVTAFRCPECGHRAVQLSIFLPVRDMEKGEETLYFEQGEMDALIWNTRL